MSFTALAAPSGGDGGAGSGGFGGVGGVGGAGSGSGGGAGANGDAGNFTAGGGGGGGAPRGTGGTGGEGAGGISGGGPGANGANAAANQSSGGGGGGGNGGGNGLTTATPQTISSPVAGGAGQNGGAGGSSTAGGVDGGGGGGGGAAGDGLDITAGGTFTNSSTVRGGDGGSGGNGGNGNPAPLVTPTYSSGGNGGNGGDAGVGVNVTSTGATLINNGTIAGGNGGGGGTGGTGLFDPGTGDGGSGTNGTAGAGGIGIKGAGLTIINSGSITGGTSGDGSTQADAIEFTDTSALAGTLEITGTSSINGNVVDTGGTYNFVLGGTTNGSFNTALIGTQYQDAGNFQLDAESATTVWTLSGTNAYTGPVEITQGILNVTAGTLNSASAVTFNGGTLQAGGTFALSNTVQVTSAGGTIDAAGQLLTLNGDITDGTGGSPGALTFTSSGGVGIILLGGNNAYSAASVVQGNTSLIANSSGGFSAGSDYTIDGGGFLEINGFNSTIRSLSGAGTVADDSPTSATLTIALPNGTQTFSGTIVDDVGSDNGVLSLAKTGGGTQVLSGENTYSGPTDVDAGTLEVDGSIASSRVTDVASGGTLTGTGWVGATTINAGGTFAPGTIGTPGSSMTVNGNLTLAASSTYQIYLNPTTSLANVNGTASLGGTVQASFANGSYISKTYTILTTTGGVSGTFSGVTNVSLPTNFTDKLAYDSKNAYLDLTLNYEPPPPPQPLAGLNQNQFNVATTLANYFNTNGGIPTKFGALPGAALSQIDGEGNTGAERPAIQLESEFLNAMLDPFADGRFGDQGAANSGVGGTAQPLGYTAEELFTSRAVASAYSGFLKEPPTFYVPHWTAWGGAYGGVSNSDGNAATGSHRLNANTFGFAGGMDYHVSADTIVGFALGGGGTNWNLASLSGSGHSAALQAGVYAFTRAGPLYGAAAFGFTNNWFNTNRTALGDQLHANFGGQSYGGRLEEGYRLREFLPAGLPDITPYAAIQTQDFQTPKYSENDIAGGGFGLSYASMGAVDVRTEIGSRLEEVTAIDNIPLVLRSKLAWAHDFVDNPWLNASFQSLPGTSFIVNGAPIPHNSALVSGGAELFLAPGWSILAKFDGEFAGNSQTYGGNGTLRYTW